MKEELINREVLVQAAQKRGLDKNAEVAAQMDMARQAVLVRALFESEVKANPITDLDLQKQYEDFKKSMGENEYKIRHILVDKEDDAKAIIADLGKGGDFAKLAKEKSKDPGSKDNGGDLDWGPTARYVKPFADAVMAMKKGQTHDGAGEDRLRLPRDPPRRRAPAEGAGLRRAEGAVPPARPAAAGPEAGDGPAQQGEGGGALAASPSGCHERAPAGALPFGSRLPRERGWG